MSRLKTIAGLKRRIIALAALWFFLAIQPLWATTNNGISLTFSGCPCTGGSYVSLVANLCNNSPVIQNVYGFRFKTPSYNGYAGYGYSPGFSVSGSAPATYQQLLSPYEQLLSLNQCRTDYSFGANPVPAADDGTPYDMQILIKTGACNPIVMAPTPTPIANCAAVAAVTTTAGYYSTTCVPWEENGGADAGGFINNFSGETQIQIGIPNSCFTISGTSVQFNPTASMGGPLYMMSVAMGQEYFNVDMMQLLSQGAKEQFDGTTACGNPADSLFISTNTIGVAGLFSEEVYTFISRVQGFPQFFPYYSCISTEPDATTAITSCPNMSCSGGQALYYYLSPTTTCSTTSYIGGNSAETANSVVVASLNLWELYDALSQSTNLCWKNSLQTSGDPLMATKFLASGYNQGLNSGWQNSLPSSSNLSCGSFPQASNYVCDVTTAYNAIKTASNCSGAAVSIYDAQITWANVQSFFWGDADAGAPLSMGTGGLLMHFSLTNAQLTALYTALQCAFTTLSAHWGGGGVATGTISYRYDWLTLLRVAREYLSTINNPLAIPNSSDFNLFVTANSTNASACGSAVETTFPNLSVTSPAIDAGVTNVCPPFNLTINATDSVSVSSAQWTLDGTWSTWNNFTGTGPNYTTSITSATAGMPSSGPVTIWVQVTNPCGNTTNQAIALNVQCSTPTNTPTSTKTNTVTATPTYTLTKTPTNTLTATVTATVTNTSTQTYTFTPTTSNTDTKTVTNTVTKTFTATITNTFTATPSSTVTNTATSTATLANTATQTSTPTKTVTNTATSTATLANTATLTNTPTRTFTSTPSSTPTLTPTVTLTPTGTVPATGTYTNSPTLTDTSSVTATPTLTATPVNTYTATSSFTATATSTYSSTFTVTDTPINTYTVTNTLTTTPTNTNSATATYTLLYTATSTGTFTASPTASPTAIFTSTSTYTTTQSFTMTPTYSSTSTSTYSATATTTSSATATATKTITNTVSATVTVTPTNTSAPETFFVSKNVFSSSDPVSINVSTTEYPGNYSLTIFNSAGEHIKTLDSRYLTGPFSQPYQWDGKNKYGDHCASGVYIIYLSLPMKTRRAKVVLIH